MAGETRKTNGPDIEKLPNPLDGLDLVEVRTAPFGVPEECHNQPWNKSRWPFMAARVASYSTVDIRKFYFLDDPKYKGELEDLFPDQRRGDDDEEDSVITKLFYNHHDDWQSGPSENDLSTEHGIDGAGYWISNKLGPGNHGFPDAWSTEHYKTGIEVVQAKGGMPWDDFETVDRCFLYNIGHSTIARSVQTSSKKPTEVDDGSVYAPEEEIEAAEHREYETNNDSGVIGMSGFYYPEQDDGANTSIGNNNVWASIDVKHFYMIYQAQLTRRIDIDDQSLGCLIFPRWPTCKKDGTFDYNACIQKDGSKVFPTEFGDLTKSKDGKWTWDWPDDLSLSIPVGDNKWRQKMATVVHATLSKHTGNIEYTRRFNRRLAEGKLTWFECLLPLYGPIVEDILGSGLDYLAASIKTSQNVESDDKPGEFIDAIETNCTKKYRTENYRQNEWRKYILQEARNSSNSKINSWDESFANWEAYYEHKREHPTHHKNKRYGEAIAGGACGSFAPNFRGHTLDGRPGVAKDKARCNEFIFYFGNDLANEGVKKLHDKYFPHHLNPDGTTNEFCDCYKTGTPRWDQPVPGSGPDKNTKFKAHTNLPKNFKRRPFRNDGPHGRYPLHWDLGQGMIGGLVGNNPIPPGADEDVPRPDSEAAGDSFDQQLEDWLRRLGDLEVDRENGETLVDALDPDAPDWQRRWAERFDRVWERRRAREEERERREEEIRARLEEEIQDILDQLPDVPDHEPIMPDHDWTMQEIIDWLDGIHNGDIEFPGGPILQPDIDWGEIFPNLPDGFFEQFWDPDNGGFDWARFWAEFWDKFFDFDLPGLIGDNNDGNLPDWFPDLSNLFPHLPESDDLLGWIELIEEIIKNFDLKKLLKKFLKYLMGESMPPWIPGVIGKIIDAIILAINMIRELESLVDAVELMKGVDIIAEIQPRGANTRQWGKADKTDYIWYRNKPEGFFSGIVSEEVRAVVHFFELQANGMLVHMNGNSDTGFIGSGLGRVKIMRFMNFAPIYSPGYGLVGMPSALKVLNHYGFADPPQVSGDDWLQLDTRDDRFYALSETNADPHKNDKLQRCNPERLARIVNDAPLDLDAIKDILQGEEAPTPEDFPEAEVGVNRAARVFVPDGFKPKHVDPYLDNPDG